MRARCGVGATVPCVLWLAIPIHAQHTPPAAVDQGQAPAPATKVAKALLPFPDDPYPLGAAGWGPEAGNGRYLCRWAEDWTRMRAAGTAPPLKAMPLLGDAHLTVSAETRWRCQASDNAQLRSSHDDNEALLRAILGADLHVDSHFRVYAEAGTGQVDHRRGTAAGNVQNDAALQQLFVDGHAPVGGCLLGAMVGRQEFSDGPPQLVSLGDGPNLHRTWNGARLYAHGERFRLGAFDLLATRAARGAFDEEIDRSERLQGLNASFLLATDPPRANLYLDPFWFHGEDPDFRVGGNEGLDRRDTYGVRLFGQRGDLTFDWTMARQTGDHLGRDVEAWGLFLVQGLALSDAGWRPRLTTHVDVASGGDTHGAGALRGFHPLYTSSSYLGEGRFLSLSNLLLIAPGLATSPTPTTNLAIEYGLARRLSDDDAVYAGGMRAYAGTADVAGHAIGGLLRVTGRWSPTACLTVAFGFEHLAADDVLERAGLPSGSYAYASMTLRY